MSHTKLDETIILLYLLYCALLYCEDSLASCLVVLFIFMFYVPAAVMAM